MARTGSREASIRRAFWEQPRTVRGMGNDGWRYVRGLGIPMRSTSQNENIRCMAAGIEQEKRLSLWPTAAAGLDATVPI